MSARVYGRLCVGGEVPISVFVSYSHHDELLYQELRKHLKSLEYEGVISQWSDREITAGREFNKNIQSELLNAGMVLLLVSPDFMSSEYCWSNEMARAMERHEAAATRVVPIILRPVDWRRSPFGKLLAIPKDGRPVTIWENRDEAFVDVTRQLRLATLEIQGKVSEFCDEGDAKNSDAREGHLVPVALKKIEGPGRTSVGSYAVTVDGKQIGLVTTGSTINFTVSPGEHLIEVHHMWLKSNRLVVNARRREHVLLECWNIVSDKSLTAAFSWNTPAVLIRRIA
jgi:hypothetical protein